MYDKHTYTHSVQIQLTFDHLQCLNKHYLFIYMLRVYVVYTHIPNR